MRGVQDGDTVETRVVVEPAVQSEFGLAGAAPEAVVQATIEFLLQRQRLDELPAQLDLEDVAAAYEDFAAHLRAQFGASEG